MFLALLVKLAAQDFISPLHLKNVFKSAEGEVNTAKLNLQILRKYNNRLFISGSYEMSNSYSNFDISSVNTLLSESLSKRIAL